MRKINTVCEVRDRGLNQSNKSRPIESGFIGRDRGSNLSAVLSLHYNVSSLRNALGDVNYFLLILSALKKEAGDRADKL